MSMRVPINSKVYLSKIEQDICLLLAKMRYDNNRLEEIKNSKIGNQSNEETDIEGIGAEWAFCKLFNVFLDFSIYTRTSQEDKGDALLPCGKSVDVKTTKYATGKLLAVPWKSRHIDLFALMVGVFPSYTFKGFMRAGELLTPKRLGSLGYGKTYIAEQKELKELEEIICS
jgi:hypothetical protein